MSVTTDPTNPMFELIHNSNLIEDINDPEEDLQSLRAWNFINKQAHISQPTLLKMHALITKNQLPPNECGRYRTVNVWVGNHVPPEPFLAQQLCYNWLMDLLEHYLTLDPVQMHIRFEHIHPFVDGNGRTGRMLMWWHQKKLGKTPMLIPFEDRQGYYKWFVEKKKPKFI